jgi:hypothetical protein
MWRDDVHKKECTWHIIIIIIIIVVVVVVVVVVIVMQPNHNFHLMKLRKNTVFDKYVSFLQFQMWPHSTTSKLSVKLP